MKMHMNLATHDLAASIAFYTTLLDAQPEKSLSDYALFITEQLELALDLDADVAVGSGQHFGIVVDSSAAVLAQHARLAGAGHAVDLETAETCCYAKQTKVWATDPDGRRWETYFVHDDTENRDGNAVCCAT